MLSFLPLLKSLNKFILAHRLDLEPIIVLLRLCFAVFIHSAIYRVYYVSNTMLSSGNKQPLRSHDTIPVLMGLTVELL